MKNAIKSILKKMGYEIRKLPHIVNKSGKNYESGLTMLDALSRCKERGVRVKSVIDIGASDGRWSLECSKIFPAAQYLLVEAQSDHEIGLKKNLVNRANFSYTISAAGDERKTAYFNNDSLFGGTAHKERIEGGIEVQMTTIDYEVKKRSLLPPYLVKLDTHGFEVPILVGAEETLKQASLIIIEAYNYKLEADSLKYYEICRFMEERGFSTIELADVMLRQYDASFWQMDIFFIPSTSKEFEFRSYK